MAMPKNPPNGCPECGHVDPSYDTLEVNGIEVTQEASCPRCNAMWREVYTFDRIETVSA